MAADEAREAEAMAWSEGLAGTWRMSAAESDNPHRGEVWWVAFDPSLGGEIKKTRPAIVVATMPPTARSTGCRWCR